MSEEMKKDELESYQDNISDAVGDGGGCAEAWSAMSESRESDDPEPSRRGIIKIFGTGAAAAVGLGAGSGSAAASPAQKETSKPQSDRKFEFTEITGSDARKTVSKALKSETFKDFRQALKEEAGYVPVARDPTVLEVEDPDGNPHRILSLELQNAGSDLSEEDILQKDAAITVKDDEIIAVKAAINTGEEPSKDEIVISSRSYDMAESGLKANTANAKVQPDVSESEFNTLVNDNSESISLLSDNSASCFSCKVVGDAVCTISCGVGVTAICAATAVANLAAGFGCVVIAGAICTVFQATHSRYTGANCFGDIGITYACYYADYCEEP